MARSLLNRIAIITLCGMAGTACSPAPTSAPAEDTSEAELAATIALQAVELGLGDIEVGLIIEARLKGGRDLGSIQYEETETVKHELAKVSVTVLPPYPDELWLTFKCENSITYPGNTVVAKAKVLANGKVLSTFQLVYDIVKDRQLYVHEVDVLEGLETIPESMLVYVEVEATLLKDTLAKDVDRESVELSPDDTTIVRSSLVRIEFKT